MIYNFSTLAMILTTNPAKALLVGTPVALDPLLVAPGFGRVVRKIAAGGAVLPRGWGNGLVTYTCHRKQFTY